MTDETVDLTVEERAAGAVEAAERGDYRAALVGLAEIVVALATELEGRRPRHSPEDDHEAFRDRRARRRSLGVND